jgi:hypothetical protein
MMTREISIIEFERNMFDLALHGVEKTAIDNLRSNFYDEYKQQKDTKKKNKLDINYFRMLGLSVGKENKTVVKR